MSRRRAPIEILVSSVASWDITDVEPHSCDCGEPAVNRVVFWQGEIRVGVGWTCAKHTPPASTVPSMIA